MPITLNHSNISVQYSSDKSYIIETVKSDLYLKNDNYDNIVRNNLQTAPVTPNIYIENGTNNVYAVESYTYSGSANTADFTRVFTKSTTCDILVVGGGGSGSANHGGGGGAGAVVFIKSVVLNSGTYTINVGKGGSSTNFTANDISAIGNKGIDSKILFNSSEILKAEGGGAGGESHTTGNGGSGGSGGGADGYTATTITNNSGAGTVGTSSIFTYNGITGIKYGNVGGNRNTVVADNVGSGGSGGGAGSPGSTPSSPYIGASGGNGVCNAIINGVTYDFSSMFGNSYGVNNDGNNNRYFGGGGGSSYWNRSGYTPSTTPALGGKGGGGDGGFNNGTSSVIAKDGLSNSGGGGGGGNSDGALNIRNGGAGGSGIVIIRYLLGTIPANNLLTNEPIVIAPTFTETIRTFLHSGGAEAQTTHTITVGRDTICDILIVGGGGGGGGQNAGGGGAGGLVLVRNLNIVGNFNINVGRGGNGSNTNAGLTGNNSTFTKSDNSINITANGGGGGGGIPSEIGKDGGSGGGGAAAMANGNQTQKSQIQIGVVSPAILNQFGENGGHGGGGGDSYPGGGGGGAGSPGYTQSGYEVGANGGLGIDRVDTYIFRDMFNTSIGDNGWFAGGGGSAGGYQNTNYAYGNGGSTLFGGGGNGDNIGRGKNGINGTGGGGGGIRYNSSVSGGNGGSGIVIIKFKSLVGPILEGITHKRLNFVFDRFGFSFDATKSVEYQAQQKTGVGGWRIVRYLPPNIGRWYQGNYISNSTFNIPTIGTPYNYTNEWAVPFGTFDEMCFGTFGMTYWLRCLKTSVLGTYDNAARPIISSSFSSTPYSANWYNRAGTGNPEDPWISIQNWPTQNMYGENSATNSPELIQLDGGMCVLVRDSATGATIPNPNQYTVNFQVPTIADINNNTNIVLRGVYDLALSTSNAVIIPKADQYIPPPTTFTNYSIERMYPPVRNFTAATTLVSGQTYGNGTYVVSYSSTYGSGSGYDFNPYTCFNTSELTGGVWFENRYTAGNFNSTSFIVTGYLGDWLKIQLPVAIKLTKFEILMRTNFGVTGRNRAPKDFKIYGSNDNITWVELINKTDAAYNASFKYEQTTPEITNTYTYYALVVNKLFSTDQVLNFDEWYIYGQEVLTSSLSLRYHLLNPTLDPTGAQWTYSSNNTNVYHMGSVGIGTTSPEYQLDVRGAIYSSIGGYTQTGLTTWSITSDRRIKENITRASYDICLENVKNIELYNFNFKNNCVNTNDKHQLGFIAQEVQQVYPKAVEVGKMILNTNEAISDILTLNTTQIDYTLYGAVKNLIEKIEDIDNDLENIEKAVGEPLGEPAPNAGN